MKQTIVDYEEYLFCKFNHKGNTLAAGGNSGLISLFTVTEQHQLKAYDTKLDHESAVGFFSWSPDDRYETLWKSNQKYLFNMHSDLKSHL